MAEADRRKLIDLRVVDLKLELEKRNIDRSGVKAVLLEKLQKALKDEGHDPDTYLFKVAAASPLPEKKPTPTRSKGRGKSDSGEGSESTGEESEQEAAKEFMGNKTDDGDDSNVKYSNDDEENHEEKECDKNNEAPQNEIPNDSSEDMTADAISNVENSSPTKQNKTDDGDDSKKTDNDDANLVKVPEEEEEVVVVDKQLNSEEEVHKVSDNNNGTMIDHEDSINLTIGEDEVKLLTEEENSCQERIVKDESQQGATDVVKSSLQDVVNEEAMTRSSAAVLPGETSDRDLGDRQKTAVALSSLTEEGRLKDDGKSATAVVDEGKGNLSDIVADDSVNKDADGDKQDTLLPSDSATSPSDQKQQSSCSGGGSSSRNLWVSGLSSTTRATDLKQVFSKFGKVVGAKVVTNARTPGARCYGYVTMASGDDAARSMKHLHLTELHGRIISVEKAKGESSWPPSRKSGGGVNEGSSSRSNKSSFRSGGGGDHHSSDRDRVRDRENKMMATSAAGVRVGGSRTRTRSRSRSRNKRERSGRQSGSSPAGIKKTDEQLDCKKKEDKLVPPGTEGMDQENTEDSMNTTSESKHDNQQPAAPGTEEQPPAEGNDQGQQKDEKTADDKGSDGKSNKDKDRDRDRRGDRSDRQSRDSSRQRAGERSRTSKDRSNHHRATSRGSRSSGHHRDVLSFQQIKEERERQRLRERERELREEERRRREERDRQRETDRKQRDEAHRLEREREKLKREREKIERERAELLQLEKERQRLERERLEREREELKRQQMRLEEERRGTKRPLVVSAMDSDRYDMEPRKRPVPVDHRSRYEASSSSSLNRSGGVKGDIGDIIRSSSSSTSSRRGHHSHAPHGGGTSSRYDDDRIDKRFDHHSGFRGRGGGGDDIRSGKERRSRERYNSSKDSGPVNLNRDGDGWHGGSGGGGGGMKPFSSMSINPGHHTREVWACDGPLKTDSPQPWVRPPPGHQSSDRWLSSGGAGGPVNNLGGGGRNPPSGIGSNIYPNSGSLAAISPLGMSSGPMYGGERFDAYKQPLGPMGRKF